MAANLLPIIAIAGAAFLLMSKKGKGESSTAPPNVTGERGAYPWGVQIVVGGDTTPPQIEQARQIFWNHARNHPALPFEFIVDPEAVGIPVTVVADSNPYTLWSENVSYLNATLADLIAQHIPTT